MKAIRPVLVFLILSEALDWLLLESVNVSSSAGSMATTDMTLRPAQLPARSSRGSFDSKHGFRLLLIFFFWIAVS